MARKQPVCGAVTTEGRLCRRLAMVGASRCHLHREDWATYTVLWLRHDHPRDPEQVRRAV